MGVPPRFGHVSRLAVTATVVAAALALPAIPAHAAATINVPGTQPTIQAGINAAVNGDTVLVAPGTYYEHIDFAGKAITVTSSGGPGVTTIDGSSTGVVVSFPNGGSAASVLHGFTITHGATDFHGGGIFSLNSSPTITGNVVTGNTASQGAGIEISSGAPTISGNWISGNNGCGGEGLVMEFVTDAVVTGNVVADNLQQGCSGGTPGGILLSGVASAAIDHNVIRGNTSGIVLWGANTATITDNVITGNAGAGVSEYNGARPKIVQNIVVGNGGPPMSFMVSTAGLPGFEVANNTMADNGAALYVAGTMADSVWWNNIVTDGMDCDGSWNPAPPVLQSNNIASYGGVCAGTPGNGNISADPQFVDAAGGNYRLAPGSPSIDAGDDTAPNLPATDFDVNPRTLGSSIDQGAYEQVTIAGGGQGFLDSEAGDPIGGGQELAFVDVAASTRSSLACGAGCDDIVRLHLQSVGHDFVVELAAPLGQTFTTGTYTGAVAPDFRSGSQPGLAIGGNVSACTSTSGRFVVDAVTFDGSDRLLTLVARLEQQCDGTGPATFVAVAYGTDDDLQRTVAPNSMDFGTVASDSMSAPRTLTIAAPGNQSVTLSSLTLSGTNAAQFALGSDTCSGTTLAPTESCTVDVTFSPTGASGARGATITFTDELAPVGGTGRRIELAGTSQRGYAATGDFIPISPTRILDTRTALGGHLGKLQANVPIDVAIEGNGGLPASDIEAVVMNVTITEPTNTSHLTVWPQGVTRPNISNLNYAPNQTIANLVTVAIQNGGVSIVNIAGQTHLVLDVVGYYSDANGDPGSRFHSLAPARLFDTRFNIGGVGTSPLTTDQVLSFKVTGKGGVPLTGPTAVVMNVTATEQTSIGHITVYPGDVSTPNASNLNLALGLNIPNLVTVKVPENGIIKFYAHLYPGQHVHLLADVVGYYDLDRSTEAGRLTTGTPVRLMDTRFDVDVLGCIPAQGAVGLQFNSTIVSAFVFNVTVTAPSGPGFITVFPNPPPVPNASNVNFVGGQTVPNLTIVKDGADGIVWFWNAGPGCPYLVVDIFGAFTNASATAPAVASAQTADGTAATRLPAVAWAQEG